MKGISALLFITALALSSIAAYYSIVGLAAIFSAAFWAVVVMATVLEISKLVVTSWLYHNWNLANNVIKTYLTTAVVVLMMITSLGIFGFLSKAHVDQSLVNTDVSIRVEQVDRELSQSNENLTRFQTQLNQLDRAINIQLDANRAQGALNARRQQEAERAQLRTRIDAENQKISQLNQQKTALRQQSSVLESKVGPIRYVAEFFMPEGSVDNEQAVRWMIMILVLVFDPLAVLMIIAANMSMRKPVVALVYNQAPQQGDIRWDAHAATLTSFDGDAWQPFTLPVGAAPALDVQQLAHILNAKLVVSAPAVDVQELAELLNVKLVMPNPSVQVEQFNQDVMVPLEQNLLRMTDVIQQAVDQLLAHPSSAPPGAIPELDMLQFKLMLTDVIEDHWRDWYSRAIKVDYTAMSQAIERTMQEWLNKNLTVSYSSDSTEIKDIVDKTVAASVEKILSNLPK